VEIAAGLAGRVFQPDAEFRAAADHKQAQPPHGDRVRGIGRQRARVSVHGGGHFAVAQLEHAGMGGTVGEHDVVGSILAKTVGAVAQPE